MAQGEGISEKSKRVLVVGEVVFILQQGSSIARTISYNGDMCMMITSESVAGRCRNSGYSTITHRLAAWNESVEERYIDD